jgi:NAD-dependent deacetylase
MILRGVKPNRAHLRLAELEKEGRLKAVVTQNIDGLHQLAGSKRVLELHGSTHRNYCMSCRKTYGYEAVSEAAGVPRCACGGIIRPDVVLYEEGLDPDVMSARQRDKKRGRLTSAEHHLWYTGGRSVQLLPREQAVLINRGATAYDDRANLLIQEKIGEVFARV